MSKYLKMTREDKFFLLSSLLCFLPIIISLFFYNKLPEEIPTHWNFAGEIDDYSPKVFALLVLPISMFLVDFITKFILLNSPKREGYPKKLLSLYKYFVPVLLLVIMVMQINSALNNNSSINSKILLCFLGIIFIILGNYMPKTKQNYVLGIKTSWTLNSQDNWNKTHKMSGYVLIISGFVLMVSAFLPLNIGVLNGIIIFDVLITLIIPIVYSFMYYKKYEC